MTTRRQQKENLRKLQNYMWAKRNENKDTDVKKEKQKKEDELRKKRRKRQKNLKDNKKRLERDRKRRNSDKNPNAVEVSMFGGKRIIEITPRKRKMFRKGKKNV